MQFIRKIPQNGLTTVSPKLEYNKPIEMPIPLLPKEEHVSSMLYTKK
jgi:hypothetical protein